MTLRAVFFDLDGTVLDTAVDMANALNALLKSVNRKTLPLDNVRKHVSNGAAALVKLGFGITDQDPSFMDLRQKLLDFYAADLASHTQPFPGIEDLIANLARYDIKWGLITNKPWAYTEPLLQHFEFARAPLTVICPDHVKQRKPAPDSIYLACEIANCKTSEVVYVGDHQRDIECGIRAGCDTIAVGYGYIADDGNHNDWGATHVVDKSEELWPLIETYIVQ